MPGPGPHRRTRRLWHACSGANEVASSAPDPETQDPDGFGTATVTFDLSTLGLRRRLLGSRLREPHRDADHGPHPRAARRMNGPVVIGFTPFAPRSDLRHRLPRSLRPEAVSAADMVAIRSTTTSSSPSTSPAARSAASWAPRRIERRDPSLARAAARLRLADRRRPDSQSTRPVPSVWAPASMAVGRASAVPAGATGALVT